MLLRSLVVMGLALWLPAPSHGEPTPSPIELTLAESRPLAYSHTHHVQGIAISDSSLFVSSVERGAKSGWLFTFDLKSLQITKKTRWALGEQFHPGGMQLRQNRLHIPLAEYKPKSTASILVVNADSTATERLIPVSDHLGAVAVSADGTLYAANWDSRQFYVLSPNGATQTTVESPTGIAYQDIEWHDGKLWCSGNAKGSAGKQQSVVDVLDTASWKHEARYHLVGQTISGNSNFSHEGFTKGNQSLYFLPEDGPKSTLYRFEIPKH